MPATTKSRRQPPRVPTLNVSRTFSPDSPLTDPSKIDLRLLLVQCMNDENWVQYTDDEKQQILRSLPGSVKSQMRRQFESSECTTREGGVQSTDEFAGFSMTAPLSADAILSNDYLKRQIARFRRDVANGYYQKTWQNQARRAQQDVADGKLDEYLRLHAEELFVDELAHSDDALAAEAASSDEDFTADCTPKRQKVTVGLEAVE